MYALISRWHDQYKKYLSKYNNKYVTANSIKPLYFISNKVNEYIEEKKKYEELWNKIREFIRSITNGKVNS